MVTRTPEGDALQEMTATLNEGISEQGTPSTFGDAMSSANFVSPQTVRNAMSKGGDSDYIKVSNMMSAVKSHISTQSTQEKVTQRFNEFVIKLHDLRLENLAQLLVERLRKKRPNYKSPLDEEASSGTNPPPVGPPGSGASMGAPQKFNSSMTVDELHSWLLSKNVPPQDCKLIKDQSINGTSFKLVSEDQWKTFGLTFGGQLIVLQQILKQVSAPSPEPSRTANGSTSNGALRNGSRKGAQYVQRNGTNSSGGEFSDYVSSLSASAQSHLDELVDWNADLNNIAHPMLDWEERLCTHLGLTVEDVHDIKVKHQNNPALQRREALRTWWNNQSREATYRNLLELFVKAKHARCAATVYNVLEKK